mmetsp:Transcript_4134/g.8480  ORF Transcript_4134/g.8480 Transcript_4134/m.8480 type:complete len:137 (-) Transcript_4134:196-606(-)|eukprot:CAMPEP_0118928900 /NCGR_PEP_ID=MMETSP1169-20130426/6041_1 /TAXON_ID=36882 /ORGANISM="Pyramimonas obovata, Strain CCMP722" /LENGTH=136 /DNA_ID=CAMNT_0006870983 /DNA_START=71 /DNA_END=481 /DNA_ORIENTATION=-
MGSPKEALEAFTSWKYRKAILYTIGEILLLYSYPVSSMAAAVAVFFFPAVALPLLDKAESMVLKPIVDKANPLVFLGLIVLGLTVTTVEAVFGGMFDFFLDFFLFPLLVVGFGFSLAVGGLHARRNIELYSKVASS